MAPWSSLPTARCVTVVFSKSKVLTITYLWFLTYKPPFPSPSINPGVKTCIAEILPFLQQSCTLFRSCYSFHCLPLLHQQLRWLLDQVNHRLCQIHQLVSLIKATFLPAWSLSSTLGLPRILVDQIASHLQSRITIRKMLLSTRHTTALLDLSLLSPPCLKALQRSLKTA